MRSLRVKHSESHWLLGDWWDERHETHWTASMYEFLRNCGDADHVWYMTDKGKVVAFVRLWTGDGNPFCLGGTWVAKGYRGQGLATRLWESMLRWIPVGTDVEVVTSSKGGRGLVRKIQRLYPGARVVNVS